MRATRTHGQKLADHLLPEGLDTFVAARRAEHKSWRQIAIDLRDATHGEVDITDVTLRNWVERNTMAAA